MPTYDYECEVCGHTFENFQDMSDPLLSECPRCQGKLRRLVGGGAGIIVKGSGERPKTRCGEDVPCCGRDIPCGKPSCE